MSTAVKNFSPAALKKIRLDHGWSLQKLASRAGVSVAALTKWERGTSRPSVVTLSRAATALGVRNSDLQVHRGPQTLVELRVGAGFSLDALAGHAGFDPATLSRAERGIGGLSPELEKALAKVYSLPPATIRRKFAAASAGRF